MTNRKTLGKKLRFEIFKRDAFTCQYCGAQPPEVVLTIDHIEAFATGGSSQADNLITACEACNSGKGASPLTSRVVRPDADLLYLETQQEIAELDRFRKSHAELMASKRLLVEQLQDYWCDVSGLEWNPTDDLVLSLLSRYSPDVVVESFSIVAPKAARKELRGSKWIPYLWGTCKGVEAQGKASLLRTLGGIAVDELVSAFALISRYYIEECQAYLNVEILDKAAGAHVIAVENYHKACVWGLDRERSGFADTLNVLGDRLSDAGVEVKPCR